MLAYSPTILRTVVRRSARQDETDPVHHEAAVQNEANGKKSLQSYVAQPEKTVLASEILT